MHSSLSKTGKKTNSQGTFRGKLQFIRTITPQFATRFIHPGTSAQKGVPSRKSFCSKTTFPGNKTYSTFSLASSRGIELLSFAARFADAVALKLIPPESQRAEQAKAGNSRRDPLAVLSFETRRSGQSLEGKSDVCRGQSLDDEYRAGALPRGYGVLSELG